MSNVTIKPGDLVRTLTSLNLFDTDHFVYNGFFKTWFSAAIKPNSVAMCGPGEMFTVIRLVDSEGVLLQSDSGFYTVQRLQFIVPLSNIELLSRV